MFMVNKDYQNESASLLD